MTVKFVELVADPPLVVITIFPVTAPVGTFAVTLVSEFTVTVVALTPPNVTSVVCVSSVPVSTTGVPTGPLVGLKLEKVGVTLKVWGLVSVVAPVVTVVTVTAAVNAPAGTVALMKVVPLRTMIVAYTPPNFTTDELLKPWPRMPIFAPSLPEVDTKLANGAAPMFRLKNTPQPSNFRRLAVYAYDGVAVVDIAANMGVAIKKAVRVLFQGRDRSAAVCAAGKTVESSESPAGRDAINRASQVAYTYVGRCAVQLPIRGLYQGEVRAVPIGSSIEIVEHGIGAFRGDFEYHSCSGRAPCGGDAIEVSIGALYHRRPDILAVGAGERMQRGEHPAGGDRVRSAVGNTC